MNATTPEPLISSTTSTLATAATTLLTSTSTGGSAPHPFPFPPRPTVIASNNLFIIILGLSILIIPVVGFALCMCAKMRIIRRNKPEGGGRGNMGGGGESGLPYTEFVDDDGNDNLDDERRGQRPKARNNRKDASILVSKDNTLTPGTPSKDQDQKMKKEALLPINTTNSNTNRRSEDAAILEVSDTDATFVLDVPDVTYSDERNLSFRNT